MAGGLCLPRNQELRNVTSKSLSHISASDVSDALQGEVDMYRVATGEVILDGLDDQLHQVTAGSHQHGDKQISLQQTGNTYIIQLRIAATQAGWAAKVKFSLLIYN